MLISRDSIQEIAATLSKNKLRTALTGFAVAWGVLLLVLLLSAGVGFQNGIRHNMDKNAQDLHSATLRPGLTSLPYKGYNKGRRIPLMISDCEFIFKSNPQDIRAYAPFVDAWANQIKQGDQSTNTGIIATTDFYAQLKKQRIKQGRFLSRMDHETSKKVIVLSDAAADVLFGKDKPCVGKMVDYDGINFQVVGVVQGDNGQWSSCFVPLNTFAKLQMTGRNWYSASMLMDCPNLRDKASLQALRKNIVRQLSLKLRFDPNDTDAIWVSSPLEEMATVSMIFGAMDALLWVIGLSTLLIGIVGVANIMQVAVRERQREIGIRKALGAKSHDIVGMILQEAVFVTLIAGLIGLVLGVSLMELITYIIERYNIGRQTVEGVDFVFFLKPSISLSTALSAILLMVISGAVAGYFPARKAVRIPAVEAMRS